MQKLVDDSKAILAEVGSGSILDAFSGKPRKVQPDPSKEVLLRAIDGKIPVRIEAERADAIRNALKLGAEFGLKWTLVGGAEATRLADELAKAKVAVILGPVVRSPLEGVDAIASKSETAGALQKARVTVAIASGAQAAASSRHLRYEACLAVRHGMAADAALRGITLVPARILGIADRVGSIEEGKDADLVVLDGPPLRSLSRVTHVVRGTEHLRIEDPTRPCRSALQGHHHSRIDFDAHRLRSDRERERMSRDHRNPRSSR